MVVRGTRVFRRKSLCGNGLPSTPYGGVVGGTGYSVALCIDTDGPSGAWAALKGLKAISDRLEGLRSAVEDFKAIDLYKCENKA